MTQLNIDANQENLIEVLILWESAATKKLEAHLRTEQDFAEYYGYVWQAVLIRKQLGLKVADYQQRNADLYWNTYRHLEAA